MSTKSETDEALRAFIATGTPEALERYETALSAYLDEVMGETRREARKAAPPRPGTWAEIAKRTPNQRTAAEPAALDIR